MRHTFYTLLFGLVMGYCICLVCIAQSAFAASRVLDVHTTVYTPATLAYNQNENTKHFERMKQWLNKANHHSTNQVEKEVQSNVVRSVHSSPSPFPSSFSISWPSLKSLNLSFLWTQQHNKQKEKDVYDDGE
jgi:hypothetical protein